MMCYRRAIFAWVMLLLGAAAAAHAASPALTTVLPRGGQRGAEVQVTLSGDRLADAQELFLYNPGITVKKLEVVNAKQVKALLAIAADAPLGEHALRVRCATGVSELRTFWVGPLPVLAEAEPNNDPAKPQKIRLGTTIEGVIKNEDLDHFSIELSRGQRVTVEVEGIRLGGTLFDPYVAILDSEGSEVAKADDSSLHLQDPVASVVAPADGTYVVQVRDSSYGGSDAARYRVHVGTFPRPRVAYPAGGQAGQELTAELVGDPAGAIKQTLKLPAEPTDEHRVVAEHGGEVAPSANLLRVSPFPDTNEAEPNNDLKSATTAKDLPAAFNGVIGAKGDTDWFRFTAKKDQQLDVHVYARRLRSPLDPTLAIGDASGKQLAANDDTAGPDSYLRFAVPADGEYTLWVADHLRGGGTDHVYRVEVTPVRPKLALTIPPVAPNSQERQAVAVPRGNRFATLVRATRADFAGVVKLDIANLPAGVTVQNTVVADGLDVVPVVFEAAATAPLAGTLATVNGAMADPEKTPVAGVFEQKADLVVGLNQTAFYQAKVDKLAVAVAEEAPFKLTIVQPKAPIVQSGAMQLKVVAERKEGFTAPINLTMPWAPPGVSAGGATIAEKATEATIPLNASGDAAAKKWNVCVLGSADANGPVWVSTQLAEIEVATSPLGGKIEMAAGERGKPVQVLCKIEQKKPFEGKAKIELLGLPPSVKAAAKEITAADTEVVFDVETSEKSPIGQHKSLFCQVTMTQAGEPVVQTMAGGGVLRIDAPAPANPAGAVAAAAPAADANAKPAKPISRLEKLRLEQQAQGAKR